MIVLLRLQCLKVTVEAIQALLPELAVLLDETGGFLQRACFKVARPPLRLATTRDQPGTFQYLQVFGNGGCADFERGGQFGYGCLAQGKPRKDGATGWVGKCGERGAEPVDGHFLLHLLINRLVKYATRLSLSSIEILSRGLLAWENNLGL